MPVFRGRLKLRPAAADLQAMFTLDQIDGPALGVLGALRGLIKAAHPIPDVRLTTGERMQCSGYLFEEADDLVDRVASAIARDPDLFAGLGLDPLSMLQRMARGDACLQVHHALMDLAQRAWDAYLLDCAGATQEALRAVQQVRAEGELPVPPPEHPERARALRPAERVLEERNQRKRRARKRNQVKAAQPPPPPPKKPPLSRQ